MHKSNKKLSQMIHTYLIIKTFLNNMSTFVQNIDAYDDWKWPNVKEKWQIWSHSYLHLKLFCFENKIFFFENSFLFIIHKPCLMLYNQSNLHIQISSIVWNYVWHLQGQTENQEFANLYIYTIFIMCCLQRILRLECWWTSPPYI